MANFGKNRELSLKLDDILKHLAEANIQRSVLTVLQLRIREAASLLQSVKFQRYFSQRFRRRTLRHSSRAAERSNTPGGSRHSLRSSGRTFELTEPLKACLAFLCP